MVTCQNCRSSNPDGAKFCSNCGSALEQARPLEGERKLATVLFADVARSTALAEQVGDPEDWANIINDAFRFMNSAIDRYEGTVGRLMGDAVLAYFGAPIAHEDDAVRAVHAGLEIRDQTLRYAESLRAQYGIDFGIRVGINTGTVVFGLMGDQIKSEHTAMGDTANVAARLQSAARPGAVLISADTYRLVRHAFDVVPRGAIEVKGKSAPIEGFEVLSALAAPGSGRGLEGLRSPLVGRRAELALLRSKMSDLRAGAGSVITIAGEAGLGKSRLVAELRGEVLAAPEPPRWLEARGISYTQALPYHLWHQLGAAVIGATDLDSAAVVREKLHAFCARAGLPDEDVPFLEVMFAVDTEAARERIADYDGDQLAQQITLVTARALRAEMHADGTVVPHVLVFDDVHWADARSLDLIAHTATLVFSEPLLIICMLRPDRHAASRGLLDTLRGTTAAAYAHIALEPLDSAYAGELLGNLLHVEQLPESVRSVILRRSEGNPFFLEEVLRSLIDSGHIVQENGHWRATAEIGTVTIPDTLAGVLAARIDRLPETTKRVAQTAAVLGRVFAYPALASVCRAAPDHIDNVDPHLGTLSYEDLVREKARVPEREFIFKHALTQETAYSLLLRRRRAELHAIAGRVLEELYADRLEEQAPVLAYHFRHGNDVARTAEYSRRAAERAFKLFALEVADEHFERAYTAYEDLLSTERPQRDAFVATALDWSIVRYKLKRYAGVIERLKRVEEIARELGDEHRLAEVLSWIATFYMVTGLSSRAADYLVESNRLAEKLGKDTLLLMPFFFATDTLVDRDPAEAAKRMQQVVELARQQKMPEIEGHALGATALAYARLGDFEQARSFIAQALAASESGGHRVKEADVHLLVGVAYLEMGEVDRALEHSRFGTRLAQENNALECTCIGYYSLGVEALEVKQPGEAAREFLTSLEYADRAGWRGWHGYANRVRAGLARAKLEAGVEEGLRELETALANAAQSHDDYEAAVLSERLAGIHLNQGRLEQAEQLLPTALDYYRRASMPLYEARALDTVARLADRQHRSDAARAARDRALELRGAVAAARPRPLEIAT